MRISLVTILISSLVVAPLLPTNFAKALIPVIYLLLMYDLTRSSLVVSNIQLALILLLAPACFNLLVVDPVNIVRLFSLVYLILAFGVSRSFHILKMFPG